MRVLPSLQTQGVIVTPLPMKNGLPGELHIRLPMTVHTNDFCSILLSCSSKMLNSVEITKKTVKFIFTKKTVKFINSYQVLFFTKTNEDITVLLVEIYFHKD